MAAILLFSGITSVRTGFSQEESPWTKWQFRAPISLEGLTDEPLVDVSLPPEVLNNSKSNLSDIRIVHKTSGKETGYIRRITQRPRIIKSLIPVEIKNRAYTPNVSSSVVIDFLENRIKDQISVKTPGTNFRRKISLEGSNDGKNWQFILQNAFLFRVQAEITATGYFDKNIVNFSPNDERYMRLTVFSGPDDPEKIEILNVSVWKTNTSGPELSEVDILELDSAVKEKVTVIDLDIGYNNLPLRKLKFYASDTDFWRHVKVFGRHTESVVNKIKAEDGTYIEKTVQTKWAGVSDGNIYRFSTGTTYDQQLSISLKNKGYRYMQVHIFNNDDPPLTLTDVKVDQFARYVSFRPMKKGHYYLYFGNRAAPLPAYDLAHFASNIRKKGVFKGTLGPSEPVPSFSASIKVEDETPWSEKYSMLLWIALVFGTVILGYLVLKQIKASAPPSDR